MQKTVSGVRLRTKETRSDVKTGRTARRTIKAAGRAAQKTVKTAGRGAKEAKKGVETAVQAHGRATKAAGAVRRTATTSIKNAGKAVLSSLHRAAAAARNLAAALAAGGGVVLAVVLVLCMAGLVVASPFGIFFSGEDSGSGQTMPEVIREINQEYDKKLEDLKTSVVCDALNLSCSRASWPEVLAVYAVKTATDPDNEQEVVTMDDSKKALLKEIFWDMNELSSFTSTVPGKGGGEDITTLHITVTAKTAEEMADEFGFDDDQRQQLTELLSDEYRELWNSILYGIGAGDGEIVAVALSQVGNVGGQPYWSWYGFSYRVDWCAIFVSWCANECGYIDAGVIPKFAGCVQGSRWFKDRGQWQDRDYTPNPGDIIFFDWDNPGGFSGPQDGVPDHVGIVERVENGRVYTIEGNSGDKCCQRSYPVEYYEIYGYGCLYA